MFAAVRRAAAATPAARVGVFLGIKILVRY